MQGMLVTAIAVIVILAIIIVLLIMMILPLRGQNAELVKSLRSMEHRLQYGMGEMSALAGDMSELRKVLANVKTRGIVGEVILGGLLQEILSPEQYAANVETVPNSGCRVEYAVRMPGGVDGYVYLPIDSKFPLDAYAVLQNAYESGDETTILQAKKDLHVRLRGFAKDISVKYIEPPYTTDFAIMFLPVEGLFLEAVESELLQEFQTNYHVSITGPSTMAAMLNSLQMGFRTLAIQKKSSDVMEVLSQVKSEVYKYDDTLEQVKRHLNQVNKDIDELSGVRTRQLKRRLQAVETEE